MERMGTKMRLLTAAAAILMVLLLAGCVKGKGEIEVHLDGSIELSAGLRLDERAQSLLGERGERALEEGLEERGFAFSKTTEDGAVEYKVGRTYDSAEELQASLPAQATGGKIGEVEVKDRFFYKTYAVKGAFDPVTMLDQITLLTGGGMDLSGGLVRLMLRQVTFDLTLTLPFDLYGGNNADLDEGRSLTWAFNLAQSKNIYFQVRVPDFLNIGIAAGILLLLVAAVMINAKRKAKRKQG